MAACQFISFISYMKLLQTKNGHSGAAPVFIAKESFTQQSSISTSSIHKMVILWREQTVRLSPCV